MELQKMYWSGGNEILEGDELTHWKEFKRVKIVWIPKNLGRTDGVAPGISMDTYKVCLGLLKKHYSPRNAA
eukprot:14621945-Ditylum_brightwellii.AAC.1